MAVCVSWCREAKSSIGDLPLPLLLLTVVEQPRSEGTRPLPTTDDGGATERATTDLKSTELREHLPSHTNRLIPCIAIAIQFNRCASSTRGRKSCQHNARSLFLTCSAMARSRYNALLSAADDLGIGTEAALPN